MPPKHSHPSIFLNYRKLGGIGHANSLRKALEQRFGEGVVFQDNFSIQSGEEWEKRIPQSIQQAKVFLALIHHNEWFTKTEPLNEYGETIRLLQREKDWVRKEIRLALEANCLIIPILLPEVKLWPNDETARTKAGPEDILPFFKIQYELFNPNQFDLSSSQLVERLKPNIPVLEMAPQTSAPSKPREEEPRDPLAHLPYDPKLIDGLCHLESPYVGFNYFEKRHAPLFFGRNAEIKELYEKRILPLKPRQVLLFYGASGAGKSSLLHAGLFPRMEYQGWYVGYQRRSKHTGLDADLEMLKQKALQSESTPKLLLLDQVEEMFTDPGREDEVRAFFDTLLETLTHYPQLKIVLAFRKEYLADIKDQLRERSINYLWYSLRTLREEGVRRAINGVFKSSALKAQFEGLEEIEDALEEALVKDIMSDKSSNIAPLLQYQLRTIWDKAAARRNEHGAIHLTLSHYERASSLEDFLVKYKLKKIAQQFPEFAAAGLIHDILFYYTTPNLTAASRTQFSYFYRYRHLLLRDRPLLSAIQQAMIDEYLLIYNPDTRRCRLAHDSLSPIIRAQYASSEAPAQRAQRIVEAKGSYVLEQPSTRRFSESDIEAIREGRHGMPKLPLDLDNKIAQDEAHYLERRRYDFELAFANAKSKAEDLEFTAALKSLDSARRTGVRPKEVYEQAAQLLYPLAFLKSKSELKEAVHQLKAVSSDQGTPWENLSSSIENLPEERLFQEVKDWLNEKDVALLRRMEERFFPRLRDIPGGTFEMGEDGPATGQEQPAHKVKVSPFQMADTPVTGWQYGLYCKAAGRPLPLAGFDRGYRPVIHVSWYEAVAFCNWWSKQLGYEEVYQLGPIPPDPNELSETIADWDAVVDWQANGFRLPTEAEWEFAAAAKEQKNWLGQTHYEKWLFGNGRDLADPDEINFDASSLSNKQFIDLGWIKEIRKDGFRAATTPVKLFAESNENSFGLHDMSGNVFEWCWDRFSGDLGQPDPYYQKCREKGTVENPAGAQSGDFRVVRGGSWFYNAYGCRCSYRYRLHPILQYYYLGFRVARRP